MKQNTNTGIEDYEISEQETKSSEILEPVISIEDIKDSVTYDNREIELLTQHVKSAKSFNILPHKYTKVELYNKMQNTKPVNELINIFFKFEGLRCEETEISDPETLIKVKRLKLILFTDKGVYHTYSISLLKNLLYICNFFGDEFTDNEYKLKLNSKQYNEETRQYYTFEIR